jgi:hypothetical protein
MKRSLRNLFGGLNGRAAAPRSAPPTTTRLHVEQLEERAVPTINLLDYKFVMPGAGTFHATWENFVTGAFKGDFVDAKTGIDVAVAGKLTHLSGHWDAITFHGDGYKPLESEHVNFAGYLSEGQQLDEIIPPTMEGVLTETVTSFLTFPPHSTTSSHWEVSVGKWI